MATVTTSIQHSIGSSSQSNQARKRDKRHPKGRGISKIIFVHRWNDLKSREPSRLHKITIRVN